MRVLQCAAVLAAAALLVWPGPGRVGLTKTRRARRPRARLSTVGRGVLAGNAAAAVVLLGGGPAWWWLALPIGLAVGSGVTLAARRASARTSPAQRQWLVRYLDLVAACIDVGLALPQAMLVVGGVLDEGGTGGASDDRGLSPQATAVPSVVVPIRGVGETPATRLRAVTAMLALGADPRVAWRHVESDEDLAAVAAAARRSAVGGTSLGDALRQQAAAIRRADGERARQRVSRSAVAMTLPLAVCFLPAFLCIGLAPVIIGLLGNLDLP